MAASNLETKIKVLEASIDLTSISLLSSAAFFVRKSEGVWIVKIDPSRMIRDRRQILKALKLCMWDLSAHSDKT